MADSPAMSRPTHLVPLVLALLVACGKQDAKAPAPKFEPGANAKTVLAKLGGVTITAPDNLKVTESEGSATLEAEGFPTVTISYAQGDNNGTGTRSSTSMGKVEVQVMIPSATWTCKASEVGDNQDLVVEICESLEVAKNPNVGEMTCKTVTGFETEPVTKAWVDLGDRFEACFAPLDESGVSFGFNLEIAGPQHNFSKYSSPMIHDETASRCLDAIYDELRKSPAFSTEGLEAGQIECDGGYSMY